MNINLHIDRLILDGLPLAPRERLKLQAALEAELMHLLTINGLAADMERAIGRITGAPIHIPQDANMTVLGQQIARSVYSGIGTQNNTVRPLATPALPATGDGPGAGS